LPLGAVGLVRVCGVLWGSAETVVAEVQNEGLGEDETGSGGGAKDGLGGVWGSPSLGLGGGKGGWRARLSGMRQGDRGVCMLAV